MKISKVNLDLDHTRQLILIDWYKEDHCECLAYNRSINISQNKVGIDFQTFKIETAKYLNDKFMCDVIVNWLRSVINEYVYSPIRKDLVIPSDMPNDEDRLKFANQVVDNFEKENGKIESFVYQKIKELINELKVLSADHIVINKYGTMFKELGKLQIADDGSVDIVIQDRN